MAELFRFRCPECAKLLGVPERKVGKVVHCPQCRAELVVPEPDAEVGAGPGDADEAPEFASLGIDLGFASPLATRPADPTLPAPLPVVEAEAISFLERVAVAPPVGPEFAAPLAGGDRFPDHLPAPPEPDEPDAESASGPVVAPVEPIAPRARRRRRAPAEGDRRRDVVLPRTAAIAWALFAILALGLSFVAGLMIGHYRWK